MKKSAKLKRKTIKMIVKNLIVFAVLVAVSSMGVYSWLNESEVKKADAMGMSNVTCSVPEGLEVAVVAPGAGIISSGANATVWHKESFAVTVDDYAFLNALSFTEVTGDGKSFVKPRIKQFGSVAVADTSNVSSWVNATANSEYLSLDLVLRSTASSAIVSLDKETYCGPEAATQEWGNSLNGWSPHTVIGAVRVAVEDADTLNNLQQKLLWVPAPFLHFDPVSRNGDAQLITNITDTTNSYGLIHYETVENREVELDTEDGTYNHGYYSKSGNTATRDKILYNNNVANAGTNVTANPSIAATDIYQLPYDVPITSQFSAGTQVVYDGVTYYQHRVRVNIWVEGEDPESRAAQVNGKFKTILRLKLVG